MKKLRLTVLMVFVGIFVLFACDDESAPTIETADIDPCTLETDSRGDIIPIEALDVEDAEIIGDKDAFIDMCKTPEQAPILLSDTDRNTYRLTFELPGNYPLEEVEVTNYLDDERFQVTSMHVEVSLVDSHYERIEENVDLERETSIDIDENAHYVRFVFSAEAGEGNKGGSYFGFNDVRFMLDEGHIAEPLPEYTDPFFRTSGWTGADGIFSYNATHGVNHIGADFERLMFIFSDTYIGDVYENNKLRYNDTLVNNTLAYYDPEYSFEEGLEFEYAGTFDAPENIYDPDHYIGYHPSNLYSGDGLDYTNVADGRLLDESLGHMWKTESETADTLMLDFKDTQSFGALHLWNYNETDRTEIGVSDFALYYGDSPDAMSFYDEFTLEEAPGETTGPQLIDDDPYVDLNGLQARYLKIEILDNHEASFSAYGLGKLMAFDVEGAYLHGEASAEDYVLDERADEGDPRLWLQDGVVVGDDFYNFPILVKDDPETEFKVYRVGMSKTPIVDGALDYENASFMDSPLQARTEDGGEIFYGAAVMNLSNHPDIDNPYVYIYGYKDLNGRHLTVARVKPEDMENFNAYEFYDGETFQDDITASEKGLFDVSAEMSVTYMPSGKYEGQYMATFMENTISGRVAYAVSDTPYGPFEDPTIIYEASEPYELDHVYAYNAKMHPLLCDEDELVISYNVNGTQTSALQNARVYYPRFIQLRHIE